MKPTAIDLIQAERQRQISKEGWTHQHDDEHTFGELADAAACYASSDSMRYDILGGRTLVPPRGWPFDSESWKPGGDGVEHRLRELTKAGALIVAEMDRLQRTQAAEARAVDTVGICTLCGEPMPAGEEMFKFHGYSGPCPKGAHAARAGEGRSDG